MNTRRVIRGDPSTQKDYVDALPHNIVAYGFNDYYYLSTNQFG